jgi:spermidine/putrescine ABC transporter ATP-binding subunit
VTGSIHTVEGTPDMATQAPAGEEASHAVVLTGLRKSYGSALVVDDLDLSVIPGEFLTLLGPSGCGKTTTLNMVAGFVDPDSGSIHLGGRDVTYLPPDRRESAMVFQQYALFPHMTVFENIAFGLRMRKVPKSEVGDRVLDALAKVGLSGSESKYPRQMSGGQQQRVALARAIVVRPKVLLLDEPLSNLDLKLREQLRLELKHLQRELGLTTIFVTHDQTEALVMSDRIAVMKDGEIQQLGTPTEIYRSPRTAFVAGFVGQSNLLDADVVDVDATPGTCAVRLLCGDVVTARTATDAAPRPGARVRLLLRPESLRLAPGPELAGGSASLEGTATEVVNEGSIATVVVTLATAEEIRVAVPDPHAITLPRIGDPVTVAVPATAAQVLSA